ncbi:Predicted arabinose efflux permease, MFS family [Variovorax sp. PDC80]|uniref:MFS transporter n=1 Tax=Variovorax sp. PDC80 TaxID=1882827 RepID=UPI0008F07560|nr:MFS transporter [Variovorax sp. PDC80]SFP30460.1 Predicted arabinose efflux permease, MFS family [Variovorax sp. PDC80]
MDKRLLVLALGMFALGTDTFVMAGILPQLARSFDVDIAVAGQLTTLYAIAYALLAPTIAAVAGNVPRKQLMLAGLGIFVLANLATALAPSFAVALVSRVFAGLGAAMYSPTATGTGASIVAPNRRGQAIAVIVAGLTAATALGSPIGTVLGGLGDWRWTMYFVSAVGLAAGLGILVLLRQVPLTPQIGLRARLAPLKDSRIGWTLLTTYLGMAGNFLVYVYFSVVFDRVLVNALVFGALLVVWGASGTLTNIALARVLDRTSPTRVMFVVLAAQAVDMAFLPWTSASLGPAVVAVAIWGATGWGIQGPQQYRLVNIAPPIAPVLLGLNTAATYLGVTTAGILGAVGIHLLGAHYLSLLSVGVFMLAIFTSHMAGRRIAGHRAEGIASAALPARS